MNKKVIGLVSLMSVVLLMVGCGTQSVENQPPNNGNEQTQNGAEVNLSPTVAVEEISVDDGVQTSEKVTPSLDLIHELLPAPDNELAEGEYRWSQLLGRDSIRPIYEDEVIFVDAANAPYDDNELVIGVEINGEAKAYAIGPLNSREMVNDTVGGVPILVTW